MDMKKILDDWNEKLGGEFSVKEDFYDEEGDEWYNFAVIDENGPDYMIAAYVDSDGLLYVNSPDGFTVVDPEDLGDHMSPLD